MYKTRHCAKKQFFSMITNNVLIIHVLYKNLSDHDAYKAAVGAEAVVRLLIVAACIVKGKP